MLSNVAVAVTLIQSCLEWCGLIILPYLTPCAHSGWNILKSQVQESHFHISIFIFKCIHELEREHSFHYSS